VCARFTIGFGFTSDWMKKWRKFLTNRVSWKVQNQLLFDTQAPPTRIRIFLNPQLFLSGYGFRPHASGEFGSESGYFCYLWTGKFLNPERKSCGFKSIWIRVDGA